MITIYWPISCLLMLRYFTVINKPFFLKRSNSVHLLRLLCLSKIIIHTNVFYGKSISTNNIIRDIHCISVRVQMELVRASPKSVYSFSFLKTDCLNSWSVLNNINIHADFKPSYSKFLFWNTVKKLQFVFSIFLSVLHSCHSKIHRKSYLTSLSISLSGASL